MGIIDMDPDPGGHNDMDLDPHHCIPIKQGILFCLVTLSLDLTRWTGLGGYSNSSTGQDYV